ncbi:MAG: GGDEF domain-containing protein [Halofilum sp. (in: g-proteobacteria)]|nr:GGDEF domain-containing protein [Halofilum sp. (in: g-proteobacteria)]
MTTTESPADAVAESPRRIGVEVRSPGNAALLREIVCDHHVVELPGPSADAGDPALDLVIVDGPELARSRDRLLAWRSRAQPVILPALLIVDARANPGDRLQQELGHSVDDVLRVPVSRQEVRARIDNLLRLRALSCRQRARLEQTSEALAGANRALRTLHAGNEVLVRAQDEQELLDAVCRVVVEQERYALAWAGFVQSGDDPEIVITAAAGGAAGYADSVRLTRSGVGDGPAWRCIEEKRTVVEPDLAGNAAVAPSREQIHAYGLASVVTLPIRTESGAEGVFAIYSRATGDFRDDERDVLQRLVENIEYGLNALRADAERDRQKEAIADLAYGDTLTDLPNRNALTERLDALLGDTTTERNVAVLFIDLDHFKIINDALGHGAGDTVLRQAAQRLRQIVRPEDFVARQGGDEFIVVMAEPPRSREWREATAESGGFAEAAAAMGERLVERLGEPLIVEGYERRIGASVGISLYPAHARDASGLIDAADTAMYSAKANDTHVRLYSEGISARRQRRLTLEGRLHAALDREEFRLHYQPVFDLVTGDIEGVEALLRWPQADGGFISPGEFIPVAEDTGLIEPLGAWVLRTAVAQRAAWLRAGHDLLMAVNVSVEQLKNADAVEGLLGAIGNAADPTRIELEVTESGIMDQTRPISSTLAALHDRGFRVAVDDFGTGYSSLSRLQEMPITTLKIDKSFVDDLGQDRRGAVIARSVQHLADGLGVRCLAEGVETDLQRRLLVELGCRVGQGFLVSGAVPPDELIDMLGHSFDARDEA